MNLGFGELLIILVIVLVLFGAGRLPGVGTNIGKALRNLKNELRGKSDNDNKSS